MCRIFHKILLKGSFIGVVSLMLLVHVELYAAKGEAKEKKGVVLKFTGFELRSLNASSFALKPGLIYKGSFNNILKSPDETTIHSIITYQKGNTTFIYPYKHKVNVPKFKTPEPQKY
jgi:hypothetical protein